jgi:LCP family protein required for cell wall assembly
MPDEQSPDEGYDWLFTGRPRPQSSTTGSRSGSEDPADPEATQAMAPVRSPGPPDDHTQVLEVQPREGPSTAAPSAAQPGTQSFGGTFPAPSQNPPRANPAMGARPQTTAPYSGSIPPRSPQGAPSVGSVPPRRRRRTWWLRGLLILFVAWLLFLVVVPIWAWQKISKVDAEPDGRRPASTAGTTYLLVGSDSRAGLTPQQEGDLGTGAAAGGRTDTLILLHVPDNSGPTLLLSIPRDSYVDIPGHDKNKINAAYAFGGPQLLVQTVEQATGIRIDDYIEVGFSGFVDAVDAVGGITVCPTERIDDPKAGNLTMSKGCHDVDGHTALDYSRSRAFSLGDITRAMHQREVISAIGSKAASWKTVVLPWRYFKVSKAAADTLQVGENVGPIDLARFGWAMAHTGGSNAKRCVVPYSSLGTSTSVGSVVTWDQQKADALFRDIRDDDTAAIDCSATGQ